MKAKTINAVISKKMNEWLKSIEDESLVKLLKRDVIVTGGCITSMLLNEKVNDFDVYFKTKECTKAVAEYYCVKFNEVNKNRLNGVCKPLFAYVLDGEDVESWKNGKLALSLFAIGYPDFKYEEYQSWNTSEESKNPKDYEDPQQKDIVRKYNNVSGMLLNTPIDRIKVMVNSDGIAEDSDTIADNAEYDMNAYLDALGDGDSIDAEVMEEKGDKYKPIFLSTNAITLSNSVQLITRFYGNPEEIHVNYDFVHATNYWTFSDGVVLNQRALEAILNKELVYIGSKYPIASLVRTRKFIKRGWQINAGQFVKMSWQISELNLKDIYVLEDQLVGVDSIYFLSFISSMKRRSIEDKDFNLTQDYLTTVIDKIFG
jgi:hypothetical protein